MSTRAIFEALAREAAKKHGIDPELYVRQIEAESNFNPKAKSNKGAEGIAQFMPLTAKRFGIDPRDPVQALDAGARYNAENLKRFGSPELMLAAYNAGENAVARHGNKIPPYKETRNYVNKIMSKLNPVSTAEAAEDEDPWAKVIGKPIGLKDQLPDTANGAANTANAEDDWSSVAGKPIAKLGELKAQGAKQAAQTEENKPSIFSRYWNEFKLANNQSLKGIGELVGKPEWGGDIEAQKAYMQNQMGGATGPGGVSMGGIAADVLKYLPAAPAGPAGSLLATGGIGALTQPGGPRERLQAGVESAAGQAGGAMLGSAAGRLLRPFTPTDNARALMARDVQPTVGQATSSAGNLSPVAKMENAVSRSMPLIGDITHNAQQRTVNDWRTGAMRTAEVPRLGVKVSAPGNAGISELQTSYNDAYEELLKGQKVDVSDIQKSLLLKIKESTKFLPGGAQRHYEDLFKTKLAEITISPTLEANMPIGPPTAEATALKELKSDLQSEALNLMQEKRISADKHAGRKLLGIARELSENIAKHLDKVSPGKGQDLRDLDAGYQNLLTLEDASASAKEDGLFQPYQYKAAVKRQTPRKDLAKSSLKEGSPVWWANQGMNIAHATQEGSPKYGNLTRAAAGGLGVMASKLAPWVAGTELGTLVGGGLGSTRVAQRALLGGKPGSKQDNLNQLIEQLIKNKTMRGFNSLSPAILEEYQDATR